MRKTLSALLALLMLLGTFGCAKHPSPSTRPTEREGTQQTTQTQPPTQSTTVPPITTVPQIGTEPTTIPVTTAPVTTAPTTAPTTVPVTTTQPTPQEPVVTAYSNSTFVRVKDYIPDIAVELRYSGTNNFMGKAIYDFDDAYLRYGTVKKLIKVQDALREQGLSLKIWDAFRPAGAQYILWDACQNDTYIDDPSVRFSSQIGRASCRERV